MVTGQGPIPPTSRPSASLLSHAKRSASTSIPARRLVDPGSNGGGSNGAQYAPLSVSPSLPSTPSPASLMLVRALGSVLSSRGNFASSHGLSFDDDQRDHYAAFGYKRELTYDNFRDWFNRGDIAQRLCTIFPDDVWSPATVITDDPDPKVSTPFDDSIAQLFKDHSLWSKLQRAHTLANIGYYSILLLGVEGTGNLSDELPRLSSLDSLIYVKPYPYDKAKVKELFDGSADASNRRFGLPKLYDVKFSKSSSASVHWSRVIHVTRNPLEDEVYSQPLLEPVFNRLFDYEKVIGGGSEATYRNINQQRLFDIDPAVVFTDEEATAFQAAIDDLVHGYKSYIRTQGITPKSLSASVPSFSANLKAVLEVIAGTLGIPTRKLLGNEIGLRSSETDDEAYNDVIASIRQKFAEPLLYQIITRLVDYGAIPEPINGEYTVTWPKIDALNEQEKSEVAANLAKANKDNVESGGEPIVLASEVRQWVFDKDPIDVDQLNRDNLPPVNNPTNNDTDNDNDSTDPATIASAADYVDSEPDSEDWKLIHKVANHHDAPVAGLFISHWQSITDSISLAQLESAIESANVDEAINLIALAVNENQQAFVNSLTTRLLSVLSDAATVNLKRSKSRGSFFRSSAHRSTAQRSSTQRSSTQRSSTQRYLLNEITLEFDATNPRAIEWASTRSSSLITNVSPQIIESARRLIAYGLERGIAPRPLANLIRLSVGLRYHATSPAHNQILQLQRDIDRWVEQGLNDSQLAVRIARRATQLRRQRGLLIARTETITSANRGQTELWLQARDANQLPANVKRIWIDTGDDRECPICIALAGKKVGLEELFITDDGQSIDGPTAHPDCRCGLGIAPN